MRFIDDLERLLIMNRFGKDDLRPQQQPIYEKDRVKNELETQFNDRDKPMLQPT